MAEEKIFANGFSFKRNNNSPDFIIGKQSIKVDEAVAFLQAKQKNGWVNLEIKQAKGGNYYIELDTWEPKETATAGGYAPKSTTGDLPF
tara:strand:- start:475 stop:741 length:267 start_codon:yes stop_codon:yes gene_type:complete